MHMEDLSHHRIYNTMTSVPVYVPKPAPPQKKPRYVKPQKINQASTSQFGGIKRASIMKLPTKPLTESSAEPSKALRTKKTFILPSNKRVQYVNHKVARTRDVKKKDAENVTETDSQIIDILGIGYETKYEEASELLSNETIDFLQLQDDVLKDVDWTKHRRQTNPNFMLRSCKLIIVPGSSTDLESDISKLIVKYNTVEKRNQNQAISAIECSENSHIVLLKANEIITDLILTLASSGHISCHCQRNYPTRKMSNFFKSIMRPFDIENIFQNSEKHKFKNIAPENLILRKSQNDYTQSDSNVLYKKKLLNTLKTSKESEVDAALMNEIFPDAETSLKNESQYPGDPSTVLKSMLSEKPEATDNYVQDSNIESIYVNKDVKRSNGFQPKRNINERRAVEQLDGSKNTKWKMPARMQLLQKTPPTFDDIVDIEEEGVTSRKETSPYVMSRTDDNSELQQLRSELENIKNTQKEEMKKMQQELSELRKTIAQLNKKVEELEGRFESTTQVKKLAPRSSALGQLEETVLKLEQQIHTRELELFSTDLEIMNVPETKGEDLVNIVQDLAKTLGVLVETRDIIFADRVGSNHDGDTMPDATRQRPKQPSIIVRLARRRLRDEIIRRARLHRDATPGILVRERLTDSDKELFRLTRQIATSRGWKFIWTKQGHILAKESAKQPTYNIRSEADIERIFSNGITQADDKPKTNDVDTNNTIAPGTRQVKPIGNDDEIVAPKEESSNAVRPTYEIRFDPNHKTYIEKGDIYPVPE
uniref:FP protein C-terminal domain-containing protein n=1 Tax=Heliothis virescens TaxID=7102 RepID=A0A2A4JQ98_HELVI